VAVVLGQVLIITHNLLSLVLEELVVEVMEEPLVIQMPLQVQEEQEALILVEALEVLVAVQVVV
jgi:hypothetical protein